jgi:hypothetical protein
MTANEQNGSLIFMEDGDLYIRAENKSAFHCIYGLLLARMEEGKHFTVEANNEFWIKPSSKMTWLMLKRYLGNRHVKVHTNLRSPDID